MILKLPQFLNVEQLNFCRQQLSTAPWVDGQYSAGHQSVHVKHNLQLDSDCETQIQLSQLFEDIALKNTLFFSAALPKTVFPPMFNCYQHGGQFGHHIDNAIRKNPKTQSYIRTDLSCTIFLTQPDEYEGGELVIEDTFGSHSIKLNAGDAILYPSTSLHKVNPVTQGARIACFFWVQSFIASDAQRRILFNLDQSIQSLTQKLSAVDQDVIALTGTYHNLLREWSDV